jgi:diguanylate cyclase (GGDEF)-like protein
MFSPVYDPLLLAASLAIATFAFYVSLDLGKRLRQPDQKRARRWWLAGSAAVGLGLWCTHFVAMLAMSLPIPLGYTAGYTLASLGAGIGVAAIAQYVAMRAATLRPHHIGAAMLGMGTGLCAMHYLGVAALDMSPGIVWNPWLVAASVLVSLAGSAGSLLIYPWLRNAHPDRRGRRRVAAAFLMATSLCGMLYTAMAAAGFPANAICLSAGELTGSTMTALVVAAAIGPLALTLFTSHLDARAQARESRLNAQLVEANEQLRQHAFLDPLTGLPNRLMFEQRLQAAMGAADPAGTLRATKLAVLFIDLDGFKPINDVYGHAAGDFALRAIAARLTEAVRETDTVARVGGDEFVILLNGAADAAAIERTARRMIEQVGYSFEWAGRQLRLSCSIGVALHPEHGPAGRLLAHADAAMYSAKHAGGGQWAIYDPRMEASHAEFLSLQQDLRQAVALNQLQLHYQPKVSSGTGETLGVEALLRWNHPTRGQVGPNVFIPIAERHGLIGRMGQWVLEESCRQIAAWATQGRRMRVAINLSAHQLREEDLVERISAALEQHGVEPDQLVCEITESAAISDIETTMRIFQELGRIGVALSIDDFGTGYSSLACLRHLPARELKIDRSFISDLEDSVESRAIVRAVSRLAHDLGLRIVAEGVETEGQRDILADLGCEELQGYLFARPMPATQVLPWIQAQLAVDA